MHSAIDSEKRNIRARVLYHRRSLSHEEELERSRKIEEKLISLKEFQSARHIMFYVSKPGEVDTHKIIVDCLHQGKQVSVPITDQHNRNLVLSEICHFPMELMPSRYGVLEPKPPYYRFVKTDEIDLIIMPGVAFDRNGHRLGHGRGYYDQFLKSIKPSIPHIALAFDFQILPKIPRDIWDMPVYMIVTESEIIKCKDKKG